ncbi:MAG: antibiotic biosynthesis monooxygenase [Candidatus Acidiferrales bacterium]
MYARVTQFHIVPDKLDQFLESVNAAIPQAHQQKGFRALLALRGYSSASSVEVRVISIWNSAEDLQAGEQNFYFYQALAKVMAASRGFPLVEGQEVLFADFGSERDQAHSSGASSDETRS